jgi:hypothetical protein
LVAASFSLCTPGAPRWLGAEDSPLLHLLPALLPAHLLSLVEEFCGGDFCRDDDDIPGAEEGDGVGGGLLWMNRTKLRRVPYGSREARSPRGHDPVIERISEADLEAFLLGGPEDTRNALD